MSEVSSKTIINYLNKEIKQNSIGNANQLKKDIIDCVSAISGAISVLTSTNRHTDTQLLHKYLYEIVRKYVEEKNTGELYKVVFKMSQTQNISRAIQTKYKEINSQIKGDLQQKQEQSKRPQSPSDSYSQNLLLSNISLDEQQNSVKTTYGSFNSSIFSSETESFEEDQGNHNDLYNKLIALVSERAINDKSKTFCRYYNRELANLSKGQKVNDVNYNQFLQLKDANLNNKEIQCVENAGLTEEQINTELKQLYAAKLMEHLISGKTDKIDGRSIVFFSLFKDCLASESEVMQNINNTLIPSKSQQNESINTLINEAIRVSRLSTAEKDNIISTNTEQAREGMSRLNSAGAYGRIKADAEYKQLFVKNVSKNLKKFGESYQKYFAKKFEQIEIISIYSDILQGIKENRREALKSKYPELADEIGKLKIENCELKINNAKLALTRLCTPFMVNGHFVYDLTQEQKKYLEELEENRNLNTTLLIDAPVGSGKTYLANKVKQYFGYTRNGNADKRTREEKFLKGIVKLAPDVAYNNVNVVNLNNLSKYNFDYNKENKDKISGIVDFFDESIKRKSIVESLPREERQIFESYNKAQPKTIILDEFPSYDLNKTREILDGINRLRKEGYKISIVQMSATMNKEVYPIAEQSNLTQKELPLMQGIENGQNTPDDVRAFKNECTIKNTESKKKQETVAGHLNEACKTFLEKDNIQSPISTFNAETFLQDFKNNITNVVNKDNAYRALTLMPFMERNSMNIIMQDPEFQQILKDNGYNSYLYTDENNGIILNYLNEDGKWARYNACDNESVNQYLEHDGKSYSRSIAFYSKDNCVGGDFGKFSTDVNEITKYVDSSTKTSDLIQFNGRARSTVKNAKVRTFIDNDNKQIEGYQYINMLKANQAVYDNMYAYEAFKSELYNILGTNEFLRTSGYLPLAMDIVLNTLTSSEVMISANVSDNTYNSFINELESNITKSLNAIIQDNGQTIKTSDSKQQIEEAILGSLLVDFGNGAEKITKLGMFLTEYSNLLNHWKNAVQNKFAIEFNKSVNTPIAMYKSYEDYYNSIIQNLIKEQKVLSNITTERTKTGGIVDDKIIADYNKRLEEIKQRIKSYIMDRDIVLKENNLQKNKDNEIVFVNVKDRYAIKETPAEAQVAEYRKKYEALLNKILNQNESLAGQIETVDEAIQSDDNVGSEKYTQLTQELNEQKNKNAQLLGNIQQLGEKVRQLEQQHTNDATNIEQVKDELQKQFNAIYSQTEQEIEGLKAQNEKLSQQVVALYEQNKQLRQKLQTAEEAKQAVQQKLETAKTFLSNARQQLQNAKQHYTQLQEENNNYKQQIEQLKEEKQTLEETQNDKDNKVRETIDSLQDKIALEQTVKKQLEEQNEQLQHEINEKDGNIKTLQNELKQAQNSLTIEQQQLQNEKSNNTANVEELRRQIDELQRQIDSEKVAKENAQMAMDLNLKIIQEQGKDIAKLQNDLDNAHKQIKNLQSQMNIKDKALQEKTKLGVENSKQKEQIENLNNQINELKNKIENNNLEKRQLAEQQGQLNGEIGNLTKRIGELQQQVDGLTKQNTELTDQNQQLLKNNQELQQQYDNLSQEKSDLQGNYDNLSQQLQELQQQHRQNVENVNNLQQQLNAKQQENQQIETEKQQLQEQLKQLQQQHQTQEQERQQQADKKELEQEQRAEQLKQQINALDEAQQNNQQTIDNLNKNIQELSNANRTYLENQVKLKEQISGLQSDLMVKQDKITELEKQVKSLTQDKQRLAKNVYDYLKNFLGDKSEQNITTQDIQEAIQKAGKQAKEQQEANQNVVNSLQEKLNRLERENKDQKQQLQDTIQKYDGAEKILEELLQYTNEQDEKLAELQTILAMQLQKVNEQKQDKDLTYSDLRKVIMNTLGELQGKIDEQQQVVDFYNAIGDNQQISDDNTNNSLVNTLYDAIKNKNADSLQNAISDVLTQLNEKDNKIATQQQTINNLQEQVKEYQEKLEQHENVNKALQELQEKYNKQLEINKQQFIDLQQKDARIAELSSQVDDLNKNINELNKQIDTIQNQLLIKENIILTQDEELKKIEELRKQLQATKDSRQVIEQEYNELLDNNTLQQTEKDKKIKELSDTVDRLNNTIEQQNITLQQKQQEYEDNLKRQVQDQFKQINELKDLYEQQISVYKQKIQDFLKMVDNTAKSIETKLSDKRQEVQQLQQAINNNGVQIRTLQNENNNLQQQLQQLREQQTQNTQEQAEQQQQAQQLQQQIEDNAKLISEYRDNNKNLDELVKTRNDEIEQFKTELSNEQIRNAELQQQINNLRMQLANAESNKNTLDDVNKQLLQLGESDKPIEKQVAEIIDKLQQQQEQNKEQRVQQEQQKQEYEKAIEAATKQGKQEGITQGKAEGQKENMFDIVRSMFGDDVDTQQLQNMNFTDFAKWLKKEIREQQKKQAIQQMADSRNKSGFASSYQNIKNDNKKELQFSDVIYSENKAEKQNNEAQTETLTLQQDSGMQTDMQALQYSNVLSEKYVQTSDEQQQSKQNKISSFGIQKASSQMLNNKTGKLSMQSLQTMQYDNADNDKQQQKDEIENDVFKQIEKFIDQQVSAINEEQGNKAINENNPLIKFYNAFKQAQNDKNNSEKLAMQEAFINFFNTMEQEQEEQAQHQAELKNQVSKQNGIIQEQNELLRAQNDRIKLLEEQLRQQQQTTEQLQDKIKEQKQQQEEQEKQAREQQEASQLRMKSMQQELTSLKEQKLDNQQSRDNEQHQHQQEIEELQNTINKQQEEENNNKGILDRILNMFKSISNTVDMQNARGNNDITQQTTTVANALSSLEKQLQALITRYEEQEQKLQNAQLKNAENDKQQKQQQERETEQKEEIKKLKAQITTLKNDLKNISNSTANNKNTIVETIDKLQAKLLELSKVNSKQAEEKQQLEQENKQLKQRPQMVDSIAETEMEQVPQMVDSETTTQQQNLGFSGVETQGVIMPQLQSLQQQEDDNYVEPSVLQATISSQENKQDNSISQITLANKFKQQLANVEDNTNINELQVSSGLQTPINNNSDIEKQQPASIITAYANNNGNVVKQEPVIDVNKNKQKDLTIKDLEADRLQQIYNDLNDWLDPGEYTVTLDTGDGSGAKPLGFSDAIFIVATSDKWTIKQKTNCFQKFMDKIEALKLAEPDMDKQAQLEKAKCCVAEFKERINLNGFEKVVEKCGEFIKGINGVVSRLSNDSEVSECDKLIQSVYYTQQNDKERIDDIINSVRKEGFKDVEKLCNIISQKQGAATSVLVQLSNIQINNSVLSTDDLLKSISDYISKSQLVNETRENSEQQQESSKQAILL